MQSSFIGCCQTVNVMAFFHVPKFALLSLSEVDVVLKRNYLTVTVAIQPTIELTSVRPRITCIFFTVKSARRALVWSHGLC